MCENCFEDPYFQFNSYEEFKLFDIVLSNRCSNGNLRLLAKKGPEPNMIPKYFRTDFFECINCREVWVLSEPDFPWKGFFLPEIQYKNYVKALTWRERRNKIGCLLILILFISIVVGYLIINKNFWSNE